MNKINKENIEAYLLDFVEERLTKEEKKELFAYLEVHTEYKSMLENYDKNLILKEGKKIAFENKSILKHKSTLFYRKRIVYIASSVAALVLLLFLLKPMKNNVIDTHNCNTISLAKQTISEACNNNNIIVIDSFSKQESEIKQNNFFSTVAEKKSIKNEEEFLQQENFATEQVVSNIKEDNVAILDSGIINTNTLIAREPDLVNDTIYIIYAGSRKENTLQRVVDYVEKRTNWNMMQTVSSIKEMVEDVKEKKKNILVFKQLKII